MPPDYDRLQSLLTQRAELKASLLTLEESIRRTMGTSKAPKKALHRARQGSKKAAKGKSKGPKSLPRERLRKVMEDGKTRGTAEIAKLYGNGATASDIGYTARRMKSDFVRKGEGRWALKKK